MGNGGRSGMEKWGRQCILNWILQRRVGLVLLDTFSTPTSGQENGEKIEQENRDNFVTKTGTSFVPA